MLNTPALDSKRNAESRNLALLACDFVNYSLHQPDEMRKDLFKGPPGFCRQFLALEDFCLARAFDKCGLVPLASRQQKIGY